SPLDVEVHVNTADVTEDDLCYLTVTGTSAEHGDDGQVGRGNRANGLITPYRPMTLEASCGKNPISHVGKTYNIAARMIVDRLTKEEKDIEQAYAYIVSQIGKPINEPQVLHIEVYAPELTPAMIKSAELISSEVMKELPDIWRGFLTRSYMLY
ncbi:MAG: methionine adenosyltransferase, partial [Nitrososphaerales archaeon]